MTVSFRRLLVPDYHALFTCDLANGYVRGYDKS